MSKYVPAFPKPVRLTDPDYLRYIKRQPCLLCPSASVDPHHTKTRGAGGSDYRALPLCRKHHEDLHRRGAIVFALDYRIDLQAEQIRLLEMYVSALKDGDDLGTKER